MSTLTAANQAALGSTACACAWPIAGAEGATDVTLSKTSRHGPGESEVAVSLRAETRRWYEWNPMPSAPPIKRMEIIVVPTVSNFAKP